MLLIDFLGKKGGPISCIFATNYNSAIIRKEWKQVLMKKNTVLLETFKANSFRCFCDFLRFAKIKFVKI